MTQWFTADTHFGHVNLLKYEAEARPFNSVDEMNKAIIDNWNELVDHDDMVWILGDAAMGHRHLTLPLFKELHGYKILICGNHDHPWIGNPKREGWLEQYYEYGGFDEINPGRVAWTKIHNQTVALSHFPYEGDHTDEDRFNEFRPIDNGEWLIHGHVHSAYKFGERTINVGVDVHDLCPVNEDLIYHWMTNGEEDNKTVDPDDLTDQEFLDTYGEPAYRYRRLWKATQRRLGQVYELAEEQGVEFPYEQIAT